MQFQKLAVMTLSCIVLCGCIHSNRDESPVYQPKVSSATFRFSSMRWGSPYMGLTLRIQNGSYFLDELGQPVTIEMLRKQIRSGQTKHSLAVTGETTISDLLRVAEAMNEAAGASGNHIDVLLYEDDESQTR